jgi:hypothetical protein
MVFVLDVEGLVGGEEGLVVEVVLLVVIGTMLVMLVMLLLVCVVEEGLMIEGLLMLDEAIRLVVGLLMLDEAIRLVVVVVVAGVDPLLQKECLVVANVIDNKG